MSRFIIKYRIALIVLLLLITVPFGLNIPKLTRDAGISSLIPDDHPDYAFSGEMEEVFGAVDQVVIGISSARGIYTREALTAIRELTEFSESLEEIDPDDVISLTNIDDMRGSDGELIVEPMIDEDALEKLDDASISDLRKKVRGNPLFRGKLVSADEKSAVLLAGVLFEISLKEEVLASLKVKYLQKIAELAQRYPDLRFRFSGPAMLKAYITEYMQKDLQRLFPLAILVVAIIILFLLRSFTGMLMPILVTLFAVAWTFGLKAILGSPITIVETAIPVVLIAIGCADGIHIMSEFFGLYHRGLPAKKAIEETLRLLALPVVLTSVTTSLGFLSLLTAPGVSIKNMGVFLAFGVMVAMVFSLLFIPALSSFFRKPKSRQSETPAAESPYPSVDLTQSRFYRLTHQAARRVIRFKKLIALGALGMLCFSILGIVNIQVESDEVRYLKADSDFRMATEAIQNDLGGITSLDIIIEGKDQDFFKQPAILKAVEGLQRFCEADPLVSYSLSLVDLLKRINLVLHDNDPAYDRLAEETETVRYSRIEKVAGKEQRVEKTDRISGLLQNAQFLLLYDMSGGEAIDQYVDKSFRLGRINVRLRDMSSRDLKKLLAKIQPYLDEHFADKATVRFANHYLRVVMMDLIIDSQIYSLITVLITITLLMALIFRSPVVGMITALPVFTAVLFNFAIMWLFDVTLNVGTSIIASVGMGVGIDYSIHYFTRFRRILASGEAYDEALVKAVAETSRAILSNAFAVGLGFLVLLFSEYLVIANVGWIVAVSMFTTALGSLVVLPALLSIIRPAVKL
ncbi:MAG: RND family transporter [Deltaproteobacteria bacterium]|nr:RND family transporter [Deltaproteobacteria bacterium]